MFTVIIAENEYLETVERYRLFLKPFLENDNIAFCKWNPEGKTFSEIVPDLNEIVGRRTTWRAVIINTENGIDRKNPFDVVEYDAGRRDDIRTPEGATADNNELYEQWEMLEHERKMAAFEKAAQLPLVMLTTHFCDAPLVSKNASEKFEDSAYERYIAETLKKQELRSGITDNEIMKVSKPTQVVCIAKRTMTEACEDFETVWASHTEQEYSHFYDRNMYFDKMRYLVFDILPRTQRNYTFDYIRFVYATILFSSNELPNGCLAPNRVYSLMCETDEKELKELLFLYEGKLELTREMLEEKIRGIEQAVPKRFTDREAAQLFCAKVNVPVSMSGEVDTDGLYVSSRGIKLANGCPTEEEVIWETGFYKSQKVLKKLIKQSHRALKHAAINARAEKCESLDGAKYLNEFQLEDIKEHIENEELAMVSAHTPDLYDEDTLFGDLEENNRSVRKKIKKRMYKATTVGIAVLALLLYGLGFATLFFRNSSSSFFSAGAAAVILAVSLAVFAAVALVALLFLRHALVRKFKAHNQDVFSTETEIHEAMGKYSSYLSHMCNMRRGFEVLEATRDRTDHGKEKILVYQKHICDIEQAKAELYEIFGHYMVGSSTCDFSRLSMYDYNFDRPVDFTYPIPYSDVHGRTIDFLQAGITAEIPVDFVKNIKVRREEIYD